MAPFEFERPPNSQIMTPLMFSELSDLCLRCRFRDAALALGRLPGQLFSHSAF